MCNRRFEFGFEVDFIIDDGFNDKLIDLILECLKDDVQSALDKNKLLCSNLIYSKDIDVVEVTAPNFDALGGD